MRRFWSAVFGKRNGKREAVVDELMRMHEETSGPGIKAAQRKATAARVLIRQLKKEVTRCQR